MLPIPYNLLTGPILFHFSFHLLKIFEDLKLPLSNKIHPISFISLLKDKLFIVDFSHFLYKIRQIQKLMVLKLF